MKSIITIVKKLWHSGGKGAKIAQNSPRVCVWKKKRERGFINIKKKNAPTSRRLLCRASGSIDRLNGLQLVSRFTRDHSIWIIDPGLEPEKFC